ncbi:MAG: hypothetical protein Kow0098_24660 [Ignavibacteriaceae bacterium]
MILIYKEKGCRYCSEAEEQLKELVVPYRIIDQITVSKFLKDGIESHPVIRDEGKIYQGEQQVSAYLDQLSRLVEQWRKFQSDSCYIDDNGDIC